MGNEHESESIFDVLKDIVNKDILVSSTMEVAHLGIRISSDEVSQQDVDEIMNLALIGKLVVNGGLKLDVN